MIITEGWNKYIDELRRDLQKNRPDINITDFLSTVWMYSTNAKTATVF